MAGRSTGTKGGMMAVAIAVLALGGGAAGAAPRDGGRGGDSVNGTGGLPGTAGTGLPEIDRRVPARVETAVFALG